MAIDYWPQLLSGRAGGRRKEATATWATSDGYNVKKGHRRATLPVRGKGGGSEGRGKMHIVLDSADEMGSLNDIAI